MKTTTKIIILAVLAFIIGASLVCIGLFFDPFSLPFQDYELMPPETQQAYETRSALARVVQLSGCGIAILALFAIPIAWLVGRSMKV